MTRKERFGAVPELVIALVLLAVILSLPFLPAPQQRALAMEAVSTSQTLQNAATATGNGTAVGSPMTNCRESAVYVSWLTGVASGVVTVESADNTGYTGTWASLAVVTYASGAPKEDIVQITGIHGALRARISTAVTGQGVTVRLVCN